ncbi:MAG: SGNH/GDSL hydrolase family protein [Elusimicrobiota bacterium]
MKRFLNKYKHSPGVKLTVFLVSLLICLALLEAGLRATGFALTASRQREFLPPYDEGEHDADDTFERYRPPNGRTRLILAFGDSLTNGTNVKSYHSFPYFLYRRFIDAGMPAAVYNMGKCEESTFGAAAKLKRYLETEGAQRPPDAVVVLVGAADIFNLPLMRERMREEGGRWHDVLPAGWLYRLRIYKVFRHLRLRWRHRRAGGKTEPNSDEKFALLLGVYREHRKLMAGDPQRALAPELTARLRPVFGAEARRYELDLRRAGDFMELLADYAGRVYTRQSRYDDYFALLLEIAGAFPAGFWTDAFDGANFQFVQTYQVQSRYTAADVLRVLDRSRREHPGLGENKDFRSFHKLLTDREEVERYVNRLRMESWDEMVRLCREKGVRLVLQNYPVAYQSANTAIQRIAEKHKLPLIDNRAVFGALIERAGRGDYLEDNDHLTPAGNRVLADNVYAELAAQR